MEEREETTAETGMKPESTHAHKNPNRAEAPPSPASPTPQPQPEKKKKSDEPGFGENLAELVQFLKDTWIEYRRISWPSRQQVVKETWSVLVLVTALTLAVLAFDFAIARTVFEPMDKFAKKAGGGVGGSQTQTWGPLTPRPGAPVDQPGVPGNGLPTQKSLPANSQGTSGQPSPVPAPVNTEPAPVGNTPVSAPAQQPSGK